jgi:hypothetical protein
MGPQWEMLKRLAANDPGAPAIETGAHVLAACSLERHWRDGQAQEALRQGHWDVVVLQGFVVGKGRGFATEPEEAFAPWIALVKELGARQVLYHTAVGQMEPLSGPDDLARRKTDLDREEAHLAGIATRHGAWVAPAARAHYLARSADPTILELRWPMFGPGDCHANALGQYLVALTLYPVITGRSMVGNPWREVGLPNGNTHGQPNPDAPVLDQTEALWLQSVAWTALTGFDRERGVGADFVLPTAPAGLPDATKPEPRSDDERLRRNLDRRFAFLRQAWAASQVVDRKTRSLPTTRSQLGLVAYAIPALEIDHPSVVWPEDLQKIRATFAAMPER